MYSRTILLVACFCLIVRRSFRLLQFFSVLCSIAAWLGVAANPKTTFALSQLELDTNQSLWSSSNTTDYDFISMKDCFCTPEARSPSLVTVRGGSIVSVIDADTHEVRNPADS